MLKSCFIISEHLSPDDEEFNDYQVPITTEPLPREKISNVRQTVMSIHKSFCDYEVSNFSDDASLHRSEQVRLKKDPNNPELFFSNTQNAPRKMRADGQSGS